MAARDNRGSSRDVGTQALGAARSKVGIALIVGRTDPLTDAALRDTLGSLVACGLSSLDRALLDRIAPHWVVCPLLADGFDATQVISRLLQLGYTGQVMVIAPKLPDPAMVERELRALAPGMRLSLRLTEAS